MTTTEKQGELLEEKKETDLSPLYARSVIGSLGSGMVSPFMGAYAVKLGASSSDMGWFQSSSNLSSNIVQVFWGRLSDRLGRRVPFIVIGGLIVSSLWVPMIFVTRAYQLIVILAMQALFGSMSTPIWAALIGDLVPSANLGRANASINLWTQVGGLVATLISGVAMILVGGSFQEMLFVPLVVATVFGVVSSLIMLRIREKQDGEKPNLKKQMASDVLGIAKWARNSPQFVRYCYVAAVFEFFMSISWPLFPITQVKVLNAAPLQIALLQVVQLLVMIVFQNWAGRRADIVGRKPLLVFFRFALVSVPVAYALSPDVNTLILVSTFWGLAQAFGQTAITAYLLDISPREHRGSFIAMYNMVMGIVTFFGSLIGGYLAAFLTGLFGLIVGLQIVYLVSTFGRGIGAALYLTLKETLKK